MHEFELRPGGSWHLTLHSPNGTDYENFKRFNEVDPPRRVIAEHLKPMFHFLMTMDYEDTAGGTTLTWQMDFLDGRGNENLRAFLLAANEENFDRLEAVLQQKSAS